MVNSNMPNDEIVIKRGWVMQEQFTELFAISQSLPGPAAALLAYSLTLLRSGFSFAVLGFNLWRYVGSIFFFLLSQALFDTVASFHLFDSGAATKECQRQS